MSEIAQLPARKTSLIEKMADKFGIEPAKMLTALKSTAFKVGENKEVSNEQMMALLVVADQYGLNPWTKEIFAFPDKGGIVPVIGVDGWSRIINDNPQFDGMDFSQDDEKCTCTIYRKDRAHPIQVTEYLAECKRNTGPWGSHPKRMLRHKAMIQAARLAFGYTGIYDQDEAERIIERNITGEVERIEEPESKTESVKSKLKAKTEPDFTEPELAESLKIDQEIAEAEKYKEASQGA